MKIPRVSSPRPRFVLTLAALSLAVFSGCFRDERVAGGDDYPNSVTPLGKSTAEATRDSSEWNAHGDAPSGAPGVYDSARVPDAPPQASSAPKRAARQVLGLDLDIGFDLAGTERTLSLVTEPLNGLLRAVRVQTVAASSGQAALRAEDTTWYRPDSAGLARLVRVSGKVESQGSVRYALFEDGDGDGLLSPRGAMSVAVARFVTVDASGRREAREAAFRPGADNDFNTRGDNSLASLRRTVVSGLDTLLSLVLSDADGDGLIYNPFRDSNQVEVGSRALSGGSEIALTYRVAVFADSTRNYAHRYRRIVRSPAGIDTVLALGRDSMPDFAPGDSGFVRTAFRPASTADTLAHAENWYAVILSAQRGDAAGNRLIEVNRGRVFRKGPMKEFVYRLVPESPVSAGSFARTGALFARAELSTGGWIALDGEATATEIFGEVGDSEGRQGMVRFDLNGRVKSVSGF